jgi:hypothetical protein
MKLRQAIKILIRDYRDFHQYRYTTFSAAMKRFIATPDAQEQLTTARLQAVERKYGR